MKPSEIKIGRTYRNRGKGRTTRTVLDVGMHVPLPRWLGHGSNTPTGETVCVRFFGGLRECTDTLTLKSFAQWAGEEVEP